MNYIIWSVVIIIALIALWLIGLYNGLIRLKHRTDESWSDIDVQLKRRHNLIPNLVEAVKGYTAHEKETLEAVIKARNTAMSSKGADEKAKAENALSSTLKSIFALAESYPDLKANQNFLQLQDELSDTENKIQAARRFYNSNARNFNIKMDMFPNNIIANNLKFKKFDYFQADDSEKENVNVKF